MSLDGDITALREAKLFSELSQDQLRLLAFGADRRRLREGEYVYREAALADSGFLVLSGTIALYRGREPHSRLVARYGEGTLLGEMALIIETRRPVSARAETAAELLRIPRQLFRRLLEEYPEFAAIIHQRIASDLGQMTREIRTLESRFDD